jgi:hypothetical protein
MLTLKGITMPLLLRRLVLSLFLVSVASYTTSCTSKPVRPASVCQGIDWWELGRSDGVSGHASARIRDHEIRCGIGLRTSEIENYMNGRDAGLIDYCTTASGFAAGKNDGFYEHVCPEHLEKEFITNFELGKKVRALELETADLESRIGNLVRQVTESDATTSPLYSQIESLKERRAQIDQEINQIESSSPL